MKYVDFKVQSGLLITAAGLTLVLSVWGLMIAQFLIGIWQVISSLISVFTFREFRRAKMWHLGLSVVVIVVNALLWNHAALLNDFVQFVVFYFPCWSLAIFYYVITWKWYHANSDRSKFLPNISF